MNKPQLVQGTDAYGRPTFGWVAPGSTAPKMIDFTGGGQQGGASTIPGLDAAAGAGMNEVLSPGWSPLSSGGQNSGPSLADLGVKAGILPATQNDSTQPPADGMQGAMPMASGHRQAQGATFTPQADTRPVSQLSLAELGQRAGVLPGAPQQSANTLSPGTVVDGSGKMVQLPDNVPWGKQERQYVGGKEYYGTRTPNGLYFKIGGEVPLTTAERKEQKELEKIGRAESDAQVGASNVIDAINKARALAGRGNFGFMPVTGAGSLLNWVPGTTGRDLEGQLDTIKANMGFDKLQQMRANSPTGGALGAVSDFENKMLQATIANLETSQSHEQFMENLQRVEDTYNRIVHGPNYRKRPQANGAAAQLPQGFRLVN